MERLLCSCFGPLFRLPVRRCAFSGKMVHGLLSRQLVTKKRFEMWPVFGGFPTRFGLPEFSHVTGLPCGEFEAGYEVDDKLKAKKTDYAFWDKLFGGRRNLNLDDLAAMVVSEDSMSPGKKLRICLIIIVDGVLMPKTQKPKPTLKYVKLVEKLDKFFAFQWGCEWFWWTISTMIPPKKVLGKCDDPEGLFCSLLRQESKFLLGFPLALLLWAFEAIPALLDRLGGDDSVTLLSYVGDKLPTHTGLVLTDVLAAEHNPKASIGIARQLSLLTVLPMMEVDEDRDDGWGAFDCEISDRKVAYMVELLKKGHKFQKGEWGGGDAQESLYVHDPVVTEVKRKIRKLTLKQEAGTLMKQRRLSRYFTRKAEVGEDKYEALVGVVEGIKKELERLNKVVEKQRRILKKYKSKTGGKFSSAKLGALRRRKKSGVSLEAGNLFGGSDHDGDDNRMEDLDSLAGAQARSEPGAEKSLKEGDGVPLLYTKKGEKTEKPHVVLYGSGSNTFYVTEDEDFGELNRLVSVITREVTDAMPKKEVGKGSEYAEATKAIDGKRMEGEGNATGEGDMMGLPSEKSEQVLSVDKETGPDGENDVLDNPMDPGTASDSDGNGEKQVMELSDSSPCQRSEKHKPVEREAELAALLLAKEAFTMEKFVPTVEDVDQAFFETVLLENPKVLILSMWTQHIEVLVEYVAKWHEEKLKERRCLFLPPWLVGYLQGKAQSFNAARGNRGRVLGDGWLSGFLTKEGRRWGAEVDTLYAPMIWDGNHWVGLCISLKDWRVLVLDPNPGLKDMSVVWGIMETVSKMLPYVVANVCPPPGDGSYTLDPFTVKRMGGAYENRRSGDCGPVAVKFMEMHALGNPNPRMDGLTDELMDIMRKQWAMDLYKDWVLPVYVGEGNQ
ncbi:hypothetical protein BRARA_G00358 [Brassica rapa]|uniref:Ubiquitin-like protease family profile domain-containing protein n=1 Tax=Brassica campestris TaxID=3711 RepID=A0A397YJE1_BRACM|nr:hypothetical protein BRARA_G00358 [Brassica rapa]